jgi:transient receptor potential cation channel subfamily M protein 3
MILYFHPFQVVLISFGICRQSIINNEVIEFQWDMIWNITHEPYFMLYGEVYAFIIDPCNSDNREEMCNPGAWIVPVMMTLYLLVANILLLNLLIAVFNNTFARTKEESHQIWACQRY